MKIKLLIVALVLVIAIVVKQTFFAPSPKSLDRAWAVIDGVNLVGMTVTDLNSSIELYSKAANLTPVNHASTLSSAFSSSKGAHAISDARIQLMRSANAQLLFMQFPDQGIGSDGRTLPEYSAVPVNGPGIAHVCYQVSGETRTYQKLLEGGGTSIGDPEMVKLNSKNPVSYAYAHDKDGIILEVEHVDVAALNLPEPPKNDYRIRHVSLATPDMDRIVKFYSVLLEEPNPRRIGRLFGFSGEKLDRVSGLRESKIKMSWFQVRNLELEIIEYLSHPPEVPVEARPLNALGYNMIVFDVKDMVKARTLFEQAGGKIVSEIEPILGGNIMFGRDPDGNLIGLQKVAAKSLVSSKNFSDNGI